MNLEKKKKKKEEKEGEKGSKSAWKNEVAYLYTFSRVYGKINIEKRRCSNNTYVKPFKTVAAFIS